MINYQDILSTIKTFTHQLLMQLASCDLCGEPCTSHLLLCQSCHDDLPIFHTDIIQGDLLNWPAINQALPKITFDHLICLSPYCAPFDQWITQLKYHGRFELATLLANLLSKHYLTIIDEHQSPQAELIVSVPLHINKWQQRGFNQAHLLAKELAKKINIPYQAKLLSRNKPTDSQVGQSGKVRRKNLQNSFTVNFTDTDKKLPEHVLLIDDVVTTGATASEVSRCLKRNGVKKVTVLALCLSLPTN